MKDAKFKVFNFTSWLHLYSWKKTPHYSWPNFQTTSMSLC